MLTSKWAGRSPVEWQLGRARLVEEKKLPTGERLLQVKEKRIRRSTRT
jgi:hypothetical protein